MLPVHLVSNRLITRLRAWNWQSPHCRVRQSRRRRQRRLGSFRRQLKVAQEALAALPLLALPVPGREAVKAVPRGVVREAEAVRARYRIPKAEWPDCAVEIAQQS